MEFDCYHRVFEPSLTNTTIRRSLLPQNNIEFQFSVELKIFNVIQNMDGTTEPMEQLASSSTYTSVKLVFENSTTMSEIRESLYRPLISLPLSQQEHTRLIRYACDAARGSVMGLEEGYVNVNLEFKLLLEHDHVFHERCYPMLKKYDVGAASRNTDQDNCSICLDDLFRHGGDEEVMCTPCDHVFHGDCIKKWLDKRSSCPLCRFEMGTT